tara:strand:+ start:1577 stop:1930 length:354 start_codon:yes stop_codon:yes gene_type:complete
MDIHCISYDNNNIFILDLSLDNDFEVCAGRLYDFSEKLYQSLNYYNNNVITLNEFLDDIEDETGILPSYIMAPTSFDKETAELEEEERSAFLENVINIGKKSRSINLVPVDMCSYVL